MSITLIFALVATMIGTSFLSGIFGMAGGLILMGILLSLLSVPDAMALHAVTQMASNGWRAVLWHRFVNWRVATGYLSGCTLAFGVWALWGYIPSRPVALILLGATPFLARLAPADYKPNPEKLSHGAAYGSICMTLMLLTGVAGPLIDTFFLGGKLERRQIVATKAACQIFSHAAKFVYFGGLIDQTATVDPWMAALAIAASILGTSLARPVLERLSDAQYRRWATHIITTIAIVYLAQGGALLLWPKP